MVTAHLALRMRGILDETAPAAVGRSQEAVDYFYSLYHILNGSTVTMCHNMTRRKARGEGWAWPGSYQATTKWLRLKDDLSLSCLHREGRDVWCRRYMPYLEVDWTLVEPGAFYQCDHTQANFWVLHKGKQLRPWMTAIVDGRSRCVVGWHLDASPNQAGILRAMRMAFVDWAIPETMRIDNGKDFTCKRITGVSKAERKRLRKALGRDWRQALKRETDRVACVDPNFTGIVNELGIELIYAIPYSPWSKGQCERLFGTADTQLFRTFATYCGNAACRKPEVLETIRKGYTREQKRRYRKRYGRDWKRQAVLRLVDLSDVPTMEQARSAIADWMTIYHHAEHGGLAGETPMAVWNKATTLRRAEADALIALTQTRGIFKVGGNGVGVTVAGKRLTYGQGCTALYKHRGRTVLISQSPDDLSCCYAWTPEAPRRFIGRLDSNERIAPNATEEELREALARVNHARKDMHEARRSAATSTRSATQEMRRQQHDQAAELRATGTDSPARTPAIRPVQTGFEGASKQVRTASETPRRVRSRNDLAVAAAALGGNRQLVGPKRRGRSVSDAWLRPMGFMDTESPEDDGDGDNGREAGKRPTDLLSLIAGNRHERETE